MKMTCIKQAGKLVGDAGDKYTGLDRFGCVIVQRRPECSREPQWADCEVIMVSSRLRPVIAGVRGRFQLHNALTITV